MGKQTLSTAKERQVNLQRIISEQTTKAMEQANVENYPEAIKCLEIAKKAYDEEFPHAKLSRRTSTGPLARHFGSLKSAAEGEARDTEKETTRQYDVLVKLMTDFQSKVDIKHTDVMSPVSKQRSFSIDADHIEDQDPSLEAVRSIAVDDSSQHEESHRDDAKDPAEQMDDVVTSTSPNADASDEEADLGDVLLKVVEESAVLLNDKAADAQLQKDQETARIAAEQEAARIAAEQEAARVAAEANDPEFQFDVEMQQLRGHQLHPDLNTHRDALIKKIDELKASKDGMTMCPDLVEALKATNTLLTSPQPDLKAYEKVADKMQGHPSPGFYALGAIMILLGAAAALLAASGFGLIIIATAAAISAASFAGAGASFFGASRKGLSSDMVHLSEKVETTVQDQPVVAAP